jgi:hypothetical protein
VQRYFNNTFYTIDPTWAQQTVALMSQLGLNYNIVFLGATALSIISARLEAKEPTLFFLWSPNALVTLPPPNHGPTRAHTTSAPTPVPFVSLFLWRHQMPELS